MDSYHPNNTADQPVFPVEHAIYRLVEAETKKKMIASTREEYAFTTIDPAVTPERKHRPQRMALVLAGFLLGLGTSVVGAIVTNRKYARAHAERRK